MWGGKLQIHCLQHVPFESPEHIAVWARNKGHQLKTSLMYEEDQSLPEHDDYDWLVVLGGPMGVYDEENIPWLSLEKQYINQAIHAGKLVLGICLGAQLIAEQIGGVVEKNPWREIGWFPVELTDAAQDSVFFQTFPQQFTPFHWHGDTFRLPAEAKTLAFSAGCGNQAFEYNGHVVGLQFHLESNEDSIRTIIEHSEDEMEPGKYVQTPAEMLGQPELVNQSNELLFTLLGLIEEKFQSAAEQ
ncbi:type 1 glutamine amidotransferase [Paenibacillus sp. NPDC056722]|uniref:type 1 glutamine amidotransferase n=1 Tax=Paenibacillus sp. NPDC056722 TaxID=3345924 RepID=UPI0036CD4497